MLDIVPPSGDYSVLDVGCGLAHTLEYLLKTGRRGISYTGIDLNEHFIDLCQSKHPNVPFFVANLLDDERSIKVHDFAFLSGLFTSRFDISHDDYWQFCKNMLLRAASVSQHGFVFNATTKYVEWERDDLFHLEIGPLLDFVNAEISRHFKLCHDYGEYEYTVYVYHEAQVV